ncbi:MAG: Ni/Fe hydrogenase subunit alpha [Candidatus Helarchaeota archaeon]|nr:Ni/Fe hydrogenase subunit alpha [Candidatus Helarchaeota archaeon]
MTKTLKIDPVTRLEGHGEITIKLGDNNTVEDVQFNVSSTRFFEKFLEGRIAEHAPRIVPRICGICPIPHHLASVKAVEACWGINPPRPAWKLRELMINGKQFSSHVLHIAALQLPDLLFGPLAPPEKRNVVAVIKALPDVGKAVIEAMKFGQDICAVVGGKSVHPVTGIPGGQTKPLTEEDRDKLLKLVPRMLEIGTTVIELGDKLVNDYLDVITKVGTIPTYYCGLVTKDKKELTIWDGLWRIMDKEGKIVAEVDPQEYNTVAAEYVAPHSMATHMYYKAAGYPEGVWRANTLARINVAEDMQTPMAKDLLKKFREVCGRPSHFVFSYIWARIIETVQALEKIKTLLEDPEIVSTDIKLADVQPKEGRGVGMVEAPRGSLIHNYWTDDKGIITKANLIVATNNNIGGIELTLKAVAKQIFEQNALKDITLPEPMLK